jgi:Fibronectin type III domain
VRRLALLVALTLAAAAPAQAATYWVSPSGSSTASGADSSSNAKTLAWFNANAQAGDVCRFKSGAYSDAINPAKNGTTTSRIRYYGFPQDPGAVRVSDVHFGYQNGDYCTAKWVTTTNGFTGCEGISAAYPTGDSLVGIRTSNCSTLSIKGKSCVFDSLRVSGSVTGGGQKHWIDLFVPGSPPQWSVTNNVITNSVFTPTINVTGDIHVIGLSHAVGNMFYNNNFNFTINGCSGYFFGVEMYEGYYNTFQKNIWNFQMNVTPAGSKGLWCHRDSSSFNRYVANTVNVTGPGQLSFMLTNPGSFPGTVGNNYYGGNFIKVQNPQTGVFWFYDGTRRDTIELNVIATGSTNPLIDMAGFNMNASVFRHNTFYTGGSVAVSCGGSATATNSPRFTSNIYYCLGTNGAGNENLRVPSGARIDSAGVFYSRGSSTAARAISYGGANGAPGSGGNFGIASQSVWGSPRFVDSTFASLDARVSSTGPAVGANWTDGFAGAIAPGGGSGSDVTPPSTVGNLSITQIDTTSMVLNWTAPGDDGSSGTANLYDLRWSKTPITSANFGSATPVSPQPVPVAGGQTQSYVALGLTPGTGYYFALRARDEAGNWSGVSNVPSGVTPGPDVTPPSPINDLTASP